MFSLFLGFASTVLKNKKSKSFTKTKSTVPGQEVEKEIFIKNDDDHDIDNNRNSEKVSVNLKSVNKNMEKEKYELCNSEVGVLNVRTVSVLLSGSEGSGLNHLAVGVAQKVRKVIKNVLRK